MMLKFMAIVTLTIAAVGSIASAETFPVYRCSSQGKEGFDVMAPQAMDIQRRVGTKVTVAHSLKYKGFMNYRLRDSWTNSDGTRTVLDDTYSMNRDCVNGKQTCKAYFEGNLYSCELMHQFLPDIE